MIEEYPKWVPPVVQDIFRSLYMDNEFLRRFIANERMIHVWRHLNKQTATRSGFPLADKSRHLSNLSGPTHGAFYSVNEQAIAILCINVWQFTIRRRDGKIFVPTKAEQDAHAELFDNLVRDCGRLRSFFPNPLPLEIEKAASIIETYCEGWSKTIKQEDNPYRLIRNTRDDERMFLFRSFAQGIGNVTKLLWGKAFCGTISTMGEVLFELDHDPERVGAVRKICAARPSQ